jgi:hypothetical protein
MKTVKLTIYNKRGKKAKTITVASAVPALMGAAAQCFFSKSKKRRVPKGKVKVVAHNGKAVFEMDAKKMSRTFTVRS